ncbi:glycosyltransferase family 4 protein [Nitrospira moscoviensis]|uniref:Putative Undecaprenyl-phosphate alpha-N-acetylglucosaminyl 1-phosphate transferase (Modular protein) n=1 Tax=Nitrospira moscoviensis TaxID=42253 RepID=A0A0K2GJK7_NITMO|nr:MraY family glycosyltransferase [Nitrospira moscoviensis]ALA61135.1 putative Undecaprenyl-phosphate alpha-N-acetylglucosaminyl 1-phosphate transferase (Modular protein) [Nitrospira moscoviensis]
MSGPLFFSFIGSLVICMALIPALMATAGRLQFVDLPGGRKIHPSPIAKVGGLAFGAGTFVAMLLWAPKDQIVTAGLLGGAVILIFGAWDDRVGLGYKPKFLGQLLAAALVVGLGGVHLTTLPFLSDAILPLWAAVPLTLFLLVAVTNALNLADGLDGLAGGLSLLSFGGMAYLAYQAGDWVVMSMMVPVLGGLLGFLRFNTYPARIFMGDAGSQFLGFYLGVCAIVLTDPTRGPYSPALVSLIWGLPILDTAGVMIQRLAERRSPFAADKNHVHHKLLGIGLSHREAVLSIYAVQALLVALAYALRWQSDVVVIAVYALFACAILALFMTGVGGRFSSIKPNAIHPHTDERGLRGDEWYSTLPVTLLSVAVPLFLIAGVFLPSHVPADMGYVAAGLSFVVGAGLLAAPTAAPILIRTGLYVGGTFVIYLIEQPAPGEPWDLHTALNVFFLGLTILIMLAIRFGVKQRFQTTPLDYLMVFLAFTIPFLPEMRVGDINLSVLTAKMIVMFLAFELMLHVLGERLTQFGVVSLWVLVMLGLRAWW